MKPKIQYGSSVRLPHGRHLTEPETVLRKVTSHIVEFMEHNPEIDDLVRTTNYWQRLIALQIPSMEGSYERYAVIHMFKVLIGLAPDPNLPVGPDGMIFHCSPQTGIRVHEKTGKCNPNPATTIRSHLFNVCGEKLWNALPVTLRAFEIPEIPLITHAEASKRVLDKYLENVADQPGNVPGDSREAKSNSIIDQIKLYEDKAKRAPQYPPRAPLPGPSKRRGGRSAGASTSSAASSGFPLSTDVSQPSTAQVLPSASSSQQPGPSTSN